MRTIKTRTGLRTFCILAATSSAFSLPSEGLAQPRVWADVTVATRAVVGGALESELLDPQPFAVGEEVAAVFDYGDMAVKAFDLESGALRWATGREGAGPGEFRNPTDIVVSAADTVWVLDPQAMRISVIGPDGSLSRLVSIRERIRRFIVGEEHLIGARSRPDRGPFVVLDRDGEYVADLDVPAWISELPAMAFELRMAADRMTGNVAAVLWYTGGILLGGADDTELREFQGVVRGEVPEPMVLTPMPNVTAVRLPPSARPIVRDVAIDGTRVYVLAVDDTDGRRTVDILDVYDERGGYLHSLRLPHAVSRLEARNGRLFALQRDMLPAITEIVVNSEEGT